MKEVVSGSLALLRPQFVLLDASELAAASEDPIVVGYVAGVVGCHLLGVAAQTGDEALTDPQHELAAIGTVMDYLFGGAARGKQLARRYADAAAQKDSELVQAYKLGMRETVATLEALERGDIDAIPLQSLMEHLHTQR